MPIWKGSDLAVAGIVRSGPKRSLPARVALMFLAPVLILGGIGASFAYLGYFGGPVLTFLPATGRPAPSRAHLTAVLLSGDMGFKVGMAPRLAERLAADGIPVIGVNSLTYFRSGRTPAQVEALLSELTRRALAFGHADKVILIGQSFGGDALHVGLVGLSHRLRQKIRMVAFVVPTDTVLFTASPSEIFTWAMPQVAAMTTARQLDWTPVTCIYGVEETASLCPLWRQSNVHVMGLSGGHPLHGDVDAVHAVLSQAIDASASDGRDEK